MQRFDPNLTSDLYHMASDIHERATALISFTDSDRTLARAAGAETIAIELSAILEGGGLRQLISSLRYSASRGLSVEITFDGLERLRRAEKLLLDASASIASFTNSPSTAKAASYLGQEGAPSTDADSLIWFPIVLVGVVGILGIIAAMLKGASERR